MWHTLSELGSVFERVGKFVVVVALVVSLGAHWAFLQSVAWATMLAGNLRTQSLSEAVTETFDGQHPCPLCKAIAAAKKSGPKSEATAPVPKLEFPPMAAKVAMIPPAAFQIIPSVNWFAQSLPQKPLLPPPRCSLV